MALEVLQVQGNLSALSILLVCGARCSFLILPSAQGDMVEWQDYDMETLS